MKEIGGYFGLEKLMDREYYPDLLAINNARNALRYLLKARKISKLYLPYFLCNSVSGVCDEEGCPYEYYYIGANFIPFFDKPLDKDEYVYIVNYYGQIDNQAVMEFKKRYGNIILDNVQAFFQRPLPGVDTIYSCRKYFGVPDGGYLATEARLEEILPVDVSMGRMKHILGRFEGNSASEYYADHLANDQSFYGLDLRYMSALTHNILGAIDYEAVLKQRNENYAALDVMLGKQNRLSLKAPDGPFAYPFYSKHGMEIKRKLAAKKIYVATLWRNVLDLEGTLEKDYAENILPLPCDQRYTPDDMALVAQEVVLLRESMSTI